MDLIVLLNAAQTVQVYSVIVIMSMDRAMMDVCMDGKDPDAIKVTAILNGSCLIKLYFM